MATTLSQPSRCIRCGKVKVIKLKFLCPCDLLHALCDKCNQVVERYDCAHIQVNPQAR